MGEAIKCLLLYKQDKSIYHISMHTHLRTVNKEPLSVTVPFTRALGKRTFLSLGIQKHIEVLKSLAVPVLK